MQLMTDSVLDAMINLSIQWQTCFVLYMISPNPKINQITVVCTFFFFFFCSSPVDSCAILFLNVMSYISIYITIIYRHCYSVNIIT